MKRRLKQIGMYAAIPALLVLIVMLERERGRGALDRLLALMKARGEEISVSRLKPAAPPRSENGFYDLAILTNRPRAILHYSGGPSALNFAAPGRVVTIAQIHEWSPDGKSTAGWDDVRSMVDEAGETFELIHAALGKPDYLCPIDYEGGFDAPIFPNLIHTKNVALALALATICELQRGQPEAAHQHLLDLVRLAAAQKSDRLVICQLVRYSSGALAFEATWQALQLSGWTDTQLAAWQAAWSRYEPAHDMEIAMEMERAMNHERMGQLKSSRAKLSSALEAREKADEQSSGEPPSLPTHGLLLKDLHAPFWRIAWADQDEFSLLAKWNVVIDRMRMALTNSWAELSVATTHAEVAPVVAETPNMRIYDRMRFLFSSETLSVNDQLILKAVRAQTQQRLVVSAIAIARYRLKYGAPPESLTKLIPEFVSAVPLDPMDGKPLRYRPLPGGGFKLYSVGADGKDDGGDPALAVQKDHFGNIWDGRDTVWPVAATDEEAAVWAAEKKKLRK